jgi:hypothetical protein
VVGVAVLEGDADRLLEPHRVLEVEAWRRKMPKAWGIMGTMSPQYVSTQPSQFTMMESGTVMTVKGTINVIRIARKMWPRPGKRRRASA